MDRSTFFRNGLLAAGGLLIGGSAIHRFVKGREPEDDPRPENIVTVHEGKGKNVLVLMSAGTKNGNTDRLTDAYIKGLVEKDHSVTKVYLGNMRMEGCRGCGVCQRNGNRCAVRDDMQRLYPLFAACDTLVMASPLYFWTITARLKSFIERLYAISVHDEYPVKETVLLMTAGDDAEDTFQQALSYFHVISGVLGGREAGVYLAGGCTGCEQPARDIEYRHLENACRLGLEL